MFTFVERWHVADSPQRVRDVLVDLEHYPTWWPQVLAVASLGPDDARVLCRSVLPYTLDLVLHAVHRELPTVEVEISGDLEGSARWTLTPSGTGTGTGTADMGAGTDMVYEQRVEVTGSLAWAARLAGPIGRWNHHRMMQGGRAGLERRLAET